MGRKANWQTVERYVKADLDVSLQAAGTSYKIVLDYDGSLKTLSTFRQQHKAEDAFSEVVEAIMNDDFSA